MTVFNEALTTPTLSFPNRPLVFRASQRHSNTHLLQYLPISNPPTRSLQLTSLSFSPLTLFSPIFIPMAHAIDMQRIPKHGPNHVYKTREQAERAKRASQRIKMPPAIYIPLRPQPKLFLKPGEKEEYYVNEKRKHKLKQRNMHRLSLSRGILFVFIALNNAVVMILLLLSLALGSGTVWEALFQIPNWFSLIIIAFHLFHRLKDRMFETVKLRNYVVYTALIAFALCSATLFIIRIQKGRMCRDFSALEPKSCHASQFLITISFLTALSAAAGNVATFHFTRIGRPVDQVPQPLHDPFTDFNIPLKHWNPKVTVFYEDMPPPQKVQPAEVGEGWVDVPLYVQYKRG